MIACAKIIATVFTLFMVFSGHSATGTGNLTGIAVAVIAYANILTAVFTLIMLFTGHFATGTRLTAVEVKIGIAKRLLTKFTRLIVFFVRVTSKSVTVCAYMSVSHSLFAAVGTRLAFFIMEFIYHTQGSAAAVTDTYVSIHPYANNSGFAAMFAAVRMLARMKSAYFIVTASALARAVVRITYSFATAIVSAKTMLGIASLSAPKEAVTVTAYGMLTAPFFTFGTLSVYHNISGTVINTSAIAKVVVKAFTVIAYTSVFAAF